MITNPPLPPWADILTAANRRAAENNLAAVSVNAQALRLLLSDWHDLRLMLDYHKITADACVTAKDDALKEVASLRKGVATAIQTLEAAACAMR